MLLYLVRHGETGHNRDGLALGRDDVPLTLAGRRQATAVAEALGSLPIDIVLSSPLSRAADTASTIASRRGITVQVRGDLTEMDVGETEGLPFSAVRERYPGLLEQWAGPRAAQVRMPGGESLADVDVRAGHFLEDLRQIDGGHVVAVTHNFVIRVLLCRLLGIGIDRFRSFGVDLSSVSLVDVGPSRASVVRLNDVCHLGRLES
jgi:broad specificity phosphatase PhoE